MQRRPLDPIEPQYSFFEAPLMAVFEWFSNNIDGDKPRHSLTDFRFETFAEAFQYFGLMTSPVFPKGNNKLAQHPQAPQDGAHPLYYLCWGAECVSKNHYYLALGNHAWLFRADFKTNRSDGVEGEFVQLDDVRIWNGDHCLRINCADNHYEDFIEGISLVVGETVQLLDQCRFQEAANAFNKLSPFIATLHEWETEKRMAENAEKLREAALRRSTP